MAKKSAAPTPEAPPAETPTPETPAAQTPAPEPQAQTPAPETPAPPPEPSILDKFKEAGFADVADEKTAAERAFEAWQQQKAEFERVKSEYEKAQPYIEYGHKFFEQQVTKPVEPEPEPSKPSSWWNPPAVDMRLVRHYQETKIDPATNEPVTTWKANTPAELKSAVDAHELYTQQWAEKLVSNPVEALQPAFEAAKSEILEEVKRLYGEQLQEQTTDSFLEQIERENADWLYRKDPLTQRPVSGQLTPEAERYLTQAAELGIPTPQGRWQYVLALREMDQLRQTSSQASTAATAAQKADEERRKLIARNGSGSPNRSGSTPPEDSKRQQNGNLRLRDKLNQALKEDGITDEILRASY